MPVDANPCRILLIASDPAVAEQIMGAIKTTGRDYRIHHDKTLVEAQTRGREDRFDLVLLDSDGAGCQFLDWLSHIRAIQPKVPVVVLVDAKEIDLSAQAVEQGASDCVIKVGPYRQTLGFTIEKNLAIWRIKRQNQALQKRLNRALVAVQTKDQQLVEATKQLESVAGTDSLTGLQNRRGLDQSLARCFAEAVRYRHDLACVMIDLDNFKLINDTLGHHAGDEVLRCTARVISATCRRSDVAGRYGGDEFVVLLPQADQATAYRAAQRIADRFRSELPECCWDGGVDLSPLMERVGISMGVATLHQDQPTGPADLVAQADQAMYRAKQTGKARIVIHQKPVISSPVSRGG